MSDMQRIQGVQMGEMAESHNVVINSNHPLIAQKLLKMKGEDRRKEFAKHLHNLARLNQNMLKGEELSAFILKSIDLMK